MVDNNFNIQFLRNRVKEKEAERSRRMHEYLSSLSEKKNKERQEFARLQKKL